MERLLFETVLVSANALLRDGLARILGAADFHIAASSSFVDDDVLDSLPQEPVILLIVDASGDFDAAIGQIEPFKRRCPTGRVAILGGQRQLQLPQMVSAFQAGANAYFTSFTTSEAFIKSLELVMLGETILPSALLTHLLNQRGRRNGRNLKHDGPNNDEDGNDIDHEEHGHNDDSDEIKAISPDVEGHYSPHLSVRQMSILHCLIEGDSNKAIARKMNIADATVKVHVKAILRKIRVDNRTQAAIWAMRHGPLNLANGNRANGEELLIQQAPSLKLSEVLPLQISSE
jgi:two-component system, NarL family, nitrate/nitrite response regulator NarL